MFVQLPGFDELPGSLFHREVDRRFGGLPNPVSGHYAQGVAPGFCRPDRAERRGMSYRDEGGELLKYTR